MEGCGDGRERAGWDCSQCGGDKRPLSVRRGRQGEEPVLRGIMWSKLKKVCELTATFE